jgi:hypothetical protein
MGAWLVGWVFGEATALQELRQPARTDHGFLVFWLAGWTVGGMFAALLFLWLTTGREIIELRPDAIVLRRTILGLGPARFYDIMQVRDLRLGPEGYRIFDSNFFSRLFDSRKHRQLDYARAGEAWGWGGGPIVFDYGARTVRCGASLDEAEAKLIIERFRQRNVRLRVEGAA